MSSVNQHTNL